jgi:hypothetical protein
MLYVVILSNCFLLAMEEISELTRTKNKIDNIMIYKYKIDNIMIYFPLEEKLISAELIVLPHER